MDQIGDYRTTQLLGEGSGGQVWLCQVPPRLGVPETQAAVKLLSDPATEEAFNAVADELKLHAVADADRLVRLFEVGYWSGRVFVAMEYATHGSLGTADGLDRDTAVRAVADAARGVHALHERGVAHRAIKPSNILLANGHAKLSEPGLTHLLSPRKTLSGLGAIGTVEFMEQGLAHGEQPGRASDVWSLGACLQYMLTGVSVYGPEMPRDSLLAALRYVFTTTAQPSSQLEGPWAEVVGRCIAADRAERYPTAEALADDIDRVHGQARQR